VCSATDRPAPVARAHGGPHDDELYALGIAPDEILDFSVNVNPYGPCSTVLEAVRTAPLTRYPDPTASAARRALAEHTGVAPERIGLGHGAAELFWTLARVLVPPGGTVVSVEPTFSEFTAGVRAAGGRVVEWRADARDGFAVDLDAVGALAHRCRAAVIYLCTPNNPTGVHVPVDQITRFAVAHQDTTLVLDQAFLSLSEHADEARAHLPAHVVAVRSLTKDHAIPGVRVGYLLAHPTLTARIEHGRAAWTTSAQAQAAALAACRAESEAFVTDSRRRLFTDRDRLATGLRGLGLHPLPSSTMYQLVRVGDAGALRRRLLERHRVLVRDCASFGLPEYIRLAALPVPADARLLAALATERSQ
jgi:histidinol-phosphate/aromatic aminotransferase/cobyric acid decarboxylase-like protein